ncbi:hypothetical protein J4207_01885 [Candidatus Woesearchaeota archaeon]|nr:hypothetical protein [Candidatus Woesearchaeota archaeon]
MGKQTTKIVLVECGPCFVHKSFDYLREDDAELWVVTGDITKLGETATLFVVRRGANWSETIKKYDQIRIQEMKARNTIDKLYREK